MTNRTRWGVVVVAVVVVLAVVIIWLAAGGEEEPTTYTPAPVTTPEAPAKQEPSLPSAEPDQEPAEPEPEPLLPTPDDLAESDSAVANVVESLSPKLKQWLTPEEQVRKWVLSVDQLADGNLPQRHKPVTYPMPAYVVEVVEPGVGDEPTIYTPREANYERLTPLIETVTRIPPRTLGRYYQSWLPLLEKAYGELGEEGSFQAKLDETIRQVLAVEGIGETPRLHRPNVFYEYVDPELEKASALEKALWRMGDDNRKALQEYLRELRFYL